MLLPLNFLLSLTNAVSHRDSCLHSALIPLGHSHARSVLKWGSPSLSSSGRRSLSSEPQVGMPLSDGAPHVDIPKPQPFHFPQPHLLPSTSKKSQFVFKDILHHRKKMCQVFFYWIFSIVYRTFPPVAFFTGQFYFIKSRTDVAFLS